MKGRPAGYLRPADCQPKEAEVSCGVRGRQASARADGSLRGRDRLAGRLRGAGVFSPAFQAHDRSDAGGLPTTLPGSGFLVSSERNGSVAGAHPRKAVTTWSRSRSCLKSRRSQSRRIARRQIAVDSFCLRVYVSGHSVCQETDALHRSFVNLRVIQLPEGTGWDAIHQEAEAHSATWPFGCADLLAPSSSSRRRRTPSPSPGRSWLKC